MRVTDNFATLGERISKDGFAIVREVVSEREIADLEAMLDHSELLRSLAGLRHVMRNSGVAAFAHDARLMAMAREVLGLDALPFRATLFDKSPMVDCIVECRISVSGLANSRECFKIRVVPLWACSSAGRARALQA